MDMQRRTIEKLIDALDNEDVHLRQSARAQLRRLKSDAMEPLIKTVQSQIGLKCLGAASILAEIEDERLIAPLVSVLSSRNPLLGQIAARALLKYGDRVVESLIDALPRCHYITQLHVVSSLEELGDIRAVEPLMGILANTNSAVLRYTVIQTLGVLGDRRAIALIKRFENDDDHHVRTRVEIALKRLGAAPSDPAENE